MRKINIIIIVINTLFIAGLIVVASQLDFRSIGEYAREANIPLMIGAVVVYLLSVLLKVLRFHTVVKHFGHRLSFKENSFIQMVGIALALITPGRIGEASKIYLLYKKSIPVLRGTGMVIYERLFDFALLAATGFLFSWLFYPRTALLWSLGAMSIITIIVIIFYQELYRLERIIPRRFTKFFHVIRDMEVKKTWISVAGIIILTFASWFFEGAFHWVMFNALGISIGIWQAMGILALGTLAGILSFLPSGIGAYELSALFLYGIIGIAQEPASLVIVVTRAISIILPFLIAIILLNIHHESFKSIRQEVGRSSIPSE